MLLYDYCKSFFIRWAISYATKGKSRTHQSPNYRWLVLQDINTWNQMWVGWEWSKTTVFLLNCWKWKHQIKRQFVFNIGEGEPFKEDTDISTFFLQTATPLIILPRALIIPIFRRIVFPSLSVLRLHYTH